MQSQMLRSLGTLAKDLTRVEMGGGISIQEQDGTSQDGLTTGRTSVSSLSSFESPKLGAYLSRDNREVLNILRIYSPKRATKMPVINSVPEEDDISGSPSSSARSEVTATFRPLSVPRLPKISALTKSERKNISRLPKANKHELSILEKLNKEFIDNNHINVSLEESNLYKKLKAHKKIDNGEAIENDNNRHVSQSRKSRRHSSISASNYKDVGDTNGEVKEIEKEDFSGEDEKQKDVGNSVFFDNITNSYNDIDGGDQLSKSPVLQLQKKLQHSYNRRGKITFAIEDQMRRNRLDLPLDFILQLEDR